MTRLRAGDDVAWLSGEIAAADETTQDDAALTRNVYVVSLVSFFQDAASELLYPVLPFFVVGVLGAPPAVLGAIEGLADGIASAIKAVSGRLADLRHRRPLVAAGYGISAGGKVLLAAAFAWPMVLLARVTDRIGKGLRGPPRDAIIADETTPANRGRAFGFHRAADTAGAVVGPLIGLALYELVGHNFRPLLWIAVIPAVISVALVFLIRERPDPGLVTHHPWVVQGLPRRYWRLLTIVGSFALVNFPDTLLLLRADKLGYGFAGVVALYVLYNLTYAGLSYPAGLISDRLNNRRLVYATGMLIFAATYLGFGVAGNATWLWVLFPFYAAPRAFSVAPPRWIPKFGGATTPGAGGLALLVRGADERSNRGDLQGLRLYPADGLEMSARDREDRVNGSHPLVVTD